MKNFILLFFSMFLLSSLGLSIISILFTIFLGWIICGLIGTFFKFTLKLWFATLILGLIFHFMF